MAHYRAREQKRDDRSKIVTLLEDAWNSFFIGCPDEPATSPTPLGAFATLEAARRWADRCFPGGEWSAVARRSMAVALRRKPILNAH